MTGQSVRAARPRVGRASNHRQGLVPTYSWVEAQLRHEGRFPVEVELESSGAR